MSEAGRPWSAQEVEVLRGIRDELMGFDDKVGSWETKAEVRQTGFSLHVRFAKRVDVMLCKRVLEVWEQASIKLCQIAARIVDQEEAKPKEGKWTALVRDVWPADEVGEAPTMAERSTADIRFALKRLVTGHAHDRECPKRHHQTEEFACDCGLDKAVAIAQNALAQTDWKVHR